VFESSSVMNPNPLDALKNFTVPFFTLYIFRIQS
jgi:hypothetical protein